MNEKELCIICAWRATCQKQFSMKAGQKCPDYCKDLTIRDAENSGANSADQKPD
ncbi:MAG TPA: hypothetical protein VK448_09280 [Dissulfurispiraceae bacterium]|nr:hypothetical protein [Dissulfurispiraceae bacterium]